MLPRWDEHVALGLLVTVSKGFVDVLFYVAILTGDFSLMAKYTQARSALAPPEGTPRRGWALTGVVIAPSAIRRWAASRGCWRTWSGPTSRACRSIGEQIGGEQAHERLHREMRRADRERPSVGVDTN